MPIGYKLVKALICLNPKEYQAYNSLQLCRIFASEMPSGQPEEEVTAGNEWIRC